MRSPHLGSPRVSQGVLLSVSLYHLLDNHFKILYGFFCHLLIYLSYGLGKYIFKLNYLVIIETKGLISGLAASFFLLPLS